MARQRPGRGREARCTGKAPDWRSDEPWLDSVPPPITAVAMAGLAISLAGVLYLGVLPARVLDWAQASVGTIF